MSEAATVYLAHHPTGVVLAMLIVALVTFALAFALALPVKALTARSPLWSALTALGFVFLTLAFLL